MKLVHTADREGKLLSFLRRELSMSSTLVKRLKFCEAYTVNGEIARTDHPIMPGDVICVTLDEPQPEYPAEEGELHILYEDEAMIAVDKPAGMLVHPSAARNTGTLANRLIAYYAKTGQKSAFHPVSRLDRDTFGVVLLAKNSHIHALLCEQARRGAVEKTYRAVVFGTPPATEGIIDAPIARLSETSLLRCIREDGKAASSAYRVLASDGTLSVLELRPLTGRTHQLRLHCAHIGCPIVGDPQYGSEESQAFSLANGIEYQQLCAVSLCFQHPLTGKIVKIRSDFAVTLDFPHKEDI